MAPGGDEEGGRGVAVKSFSCPVQFIVFCFYGRHVSLITSFFIQEYEWLTADKKGNLKKWIRKNVQLYLPISSSELRFTNFLIKSYVKLKHTILFWLYIGIQGIHIGQGEDKMCCYISYTQNWFVHNRRFNIFQCILLTTTIIVFQLCSSLSKRPSLPMGING